LKYANIAREYGAKVYYLRPKNISKDNSSDFEVFFV
jgi:CMP-N-acetylneuraminic acid synthetase